MIATERQNEAKELSIAPRMHQLNFVYFSERRIRDRRYLVAAQAVWDAKIGRSYATAA